MENNKPVDLLLWCPNCFEQHVDEAKPDVCEKCGGDENAHPYFGCDTFEAWLNPSHKSHRCSFCNHVFRPSDVPTNGVLKLTSQGSRDGFAQPRAPSPWVPTFERWADEIDPTTAWVPLARQCRDAIATLPAEAFGYADAEDGHGGSYNWPIRDELLAALDKGLAPLHPRCRAVRGDRDDGG